MRQILLFAALAASLALLSGCALSKAKKDAAEKLLSLGYQNVYDFGGVIDWPYELVKEG